MTWEQWGQEMFMADSWVDHLGKAGRKKASRGIQLVDADRVNLGAAVSLSQA